MSSRVRFTGTRPAARRLSPMACGYGARTLRTIWRRITCRCPRPSWPGFGGCTTRCQTWSVRTSHRFSTRSASGSDGRRSSRGTRSRSCAHSHGLFRLVQSSWQGPGRNGLLAPGGRRHASLAGTRSTVLSTVAIRDGSGQAVSSLCRRLAGASRPSVLRGRLSSSAATASRCSRMWRAGTGALGEVLPRQAVRVLAGAALPGAGRVAEVDRDTLGKGECLVRGRFIGGRSRNAQPPDSPPAAGLDRAAVSRRAARLPRRGRGDPGPLGEDLHPRLEAAGAGGGREACRGDPLLRRRGDPGRPRARAAASVSSRTPSGLPVGAGHGRVAEVPTARHDGVRLPPARSCRGAHAGGMTMSSTAKSVAVLTGMYAAEAEYLGAGALGRLRSVCSPPSLRRMSSCIKQILCPMEALGVGTRA